MAHLTFTSVPGELDSEPLSHTLGRCSSTELHPHPREGFPNSNVVLFLKSNFYVWVYVCVCVCPCIHVCVLVCTCVNVHVFLCVHCMCAVCTCVLVRACIHLCICVCTCARANMSTYAHVCKGRCVHLSAHAENRRGHWLSCCVTSSCAPETRSLTEPAAGWRPANPSDPPISTSHGAEVYRDTCDFTWLFMWALGI